MEPEDPNRATFRVKLAAVLAVAGAICGCIAGFRHAGLGGTVVGVLPGFFGGMAFGGSFAG